MNLVGDAREALLGSAWDEASEPYSVAESTLLLRPFSLNTLRRAGVMGLRCVRGEFAATLRALPPREALREIESLAWLLCEDLDLVRAHFRQGTWLAAADAYELSVDLWKPIRDELLRVLTLLQASLFDVEKKPALSFSGKLPVEDEPPAHLISPGIIAGLAYALAEKAGTSPAHLLEWMPACQAFQLAHCLQWGNTTIWTVDPRATVTDDPWSAVDLTADPGAGEAIEF